MKTSLREETFRPDPTLIFYVLLPKCIVSSTTESRLQSPEAAKGNSNRIVFGDISWIPLANNSNGVFPMAGGVLLLVYGSCSSIVCLNSITSSELYLSLIKEVFLCQMETTENHNWPKCQEQLIMRCLAPGATTTIQWLFLKLREHLGRGGRKIVKAKRPRNLL